MNFAAMPTDGRRIFVLSSTKPHGQLIEAAGGASTVAAPTYRE